MSDVAAVKQLVSKYNALRTEISKVIVGQDEVVEQVLLSVFSGGHAQNSSNSYMGIREPNPKP